jgi:CheY-like chemotaxis protein
VLLAEIDVQLRAGLAGALRSARLEVVEVANGFEAFRSYMRLQGEVDLVVAPFHMHEYDGLALARGLATLAPALPVLLLGGNPASACTVSKNVRLLQGEFSGADLLHHARLALAD